MINIEVFIGIENKNHGNILNTIELFFAKYGEGSFLKIKQIKNKKFIAIIDNEKIDFTDYKLSKVLDTIKNKLKIKKRITLFKKKINKLQEESFLEEY